MATLPSSGFLVQSSGTEVFILNPHTEEELVRFNVRDPDTVAKAQQTIRELPELNDEDKSFAHFWSGYFYAHLA